MVVKPITGLVKLLCVSVLALGLAILEAIGLVLVRSQRYLSKSLQPSDSLTLWGGGVSSSFPHAHLKSI